MLRDPRQAAKLGRLLAPDPHRPRHPAVAPGRPGGVDPAHHGQPVASSTSWPLDEVPAFVIHGDRDLVVPLATATVGGQARRTATLVTVRKGGHSWLLRDPETLPAIVAELLRGRLGDAIRESIGAAGAGPATSSSRSSTSPTPIHGLTPRSARRRARRPSCLGTLDDSSSTARRRRDHPGVADATA